MNTNTQAASSIANYKVEYAETGGSNLPECFLTALTSITPDKALSFGKSSVREVKFLQPFFSLIGKFKKAENDTRKEAGIPPLTQYDVINRVAKMENGFKPTEFQLMQFAEKTAKQLNNVKGNPTLKDAEMVYRIAMDTVLSHKDNTFVEKSDAMLSDSTDDLT